LAIDSARLRGPVVARLAGDRGRIEDDFDGSVAMKPADYRIARNRVTRRACEARGSCRRRLNVRRVRAGIRCVRGEKA